MNTVTKKHRTVLPVSPRPVAESATVDTSVAAGTHRFRVVNGEAAKRERKRTAMPVLCAATALGFIAAQMVFANITSQDAYELAALKKEHRDTVRVERVLAQNAMTLSSPQNLVDNANALGMVQNQMPKYLRLSDGAVLGAGTTLSQETAPNLVANSTLTALPLVGGAQAGATRQASQLLTGAAAAEVKPVPWQGELPVPRTH